MDIPAGIDIHKTRALRARRPSDGLIVPLTCSLAEFNDHWAPQGYSLKTDFGQFVEEVRSEEEPQEADPETTARGRRRSRRS